MTSGLPTVRWFWELLFGSVPATFPSAFSLEESVSRLSAACTTSIFGTLTRQAAYGRVGRSRVVLTRTIPFVHNSGKPVFVGSFEPVGNQTVLVGRFALHWAVRAFLSFWFGFCLLWTALVVAIEILIGLGDRWWFPLAGLGMFMAEALLLRVSKWWARNDIAWLSGVISRALSADTA